MYKTVTLYLAAQHLAWEVVEYPISCSTDVIPANEQIIEIPFTLTLVI